MLRKILKNTLWISISNFIGKGMAFILTIYIARYLGDAMYGKFSFALSLVGILAVIIDFGLGNLATREIARQNDQTKKYLDNIIAIKLVLSLIIAIVIFLLLIILQKDAITKQLTYLACLYIVINNFEQFFYTVFRAWEKMKYEAICHIFYNIILFILGFTFIYFKTSASIIMNSYIIATAGSFLLGLYFIRKYFYKFKIETDFSFWKKTFKQSWPFALTSVFVILYFKIDTIMLSQMRTDQEVGWYNAAYNVVFALFLIPTIFDIIFYPILAKSFTQKREFLYVVKKIFTYALFIAIPSGFIIYFLREPLITFLYHDKYPEATPILAVLLWSFVINLCNRFFFIINAANLQVLIAKQTFMGTLLNIILNYIFIPKYGAVGAAWATVIAEIFAIFLLSYYGLFKYKKEIFLKETAK